ncbi:class I SAM-dependent methyltransferase [Microterricola viridarii]|uniref:Ubiquinone/menaquinone biosynthesis C-methylase UbiE n=1 Tax=Microterricola viridarii TaxID=412690 RepID=A0A1H1TRQ9_9MICO|nr:class I SAM-dependent methyltransferase [Microterricola viridarii]SDS62897.1 Ubiquinone/menaquinone biosynthesis C-methylase UbiE [Microterricola viridarii]
MSISATPTATPASTGFELHAGRGRFNAAFFWLIDPYLEWSLRRQKRRVFGGLPREVVEIGSGVGANLRYLPAGGTLVAFEPNRYMHGPLRAAARRSEVRLDLHECMAENTGLPEASVDTVISSLVLCSVQDPVAVLTEIRRILRPGGSFRFLEHVAARRGTPTHAAQRLLRRPWAWAFEGCSCQRDLESAVRAAGFASVTIRHYRVHTPLLPFNTHIAGIARA